MLSTKEYGILLTNFPMGRFIHPPKRNMHAEAQTSRCYKAEIVGNLVVISGHFKGIFRGLSSENSLHFGREQPIAAANS